jgi:radical SAM protein (TIGR01212 family)
LTKSIEQQMSAAMKKQLDERIFMYSQWLLQCFGHKVFRVGLSTGITCPHRVATGGCIYCNPATFTGAYQEQGLSIAQQLAQAVPRIKASCGDVKLLAYFQDETSTAGDADYLLGCYQEALAHPDVEGLVVSTRPDAMQPAVMEFLAQLDVPVMVEIGLQTIHDASLDWLNRGHNFAQAAQAIDYCQSLGLQVGVHLIVGIPVETEAMMRQTVQWVSANAAISQVKFHNLVIYRHTALAAIAAEQGLKPLGIPDYVSLLGTLLTHLRGDIPVLRLFTSNVRRNQVAVGQYAGAKTKWMSMLRSYMNENNLVQGMNTSLPYHTQRRNDA